jgi:DNA polymerase III alpha subunit
VYNGDMDINKYGDVFLDPEELFENLYSGKIKNFQNIHIDNTSVINQFNDAVEKNKDKIGLLATYHPRSEELSEFDKSKQNIWFMPEEYKNFPIHQWLSDQCKTEEELARVDQELLLFIQHDMFDLLFYLKYLVDTMRKNNIVWGVGRGSSVASYVLYLIGVHKINSIRYNLDIAEFLR